MGKRVRIRVWFFFSWGYRYRVGVKGMGKDFDIPYPYPTNAISIRGLQLNPRTTGWGHTFKCSIPSFTHISTIVLVLFINLYTYTHYKINLFTNKRMVKKRDFNIKVFKWMENLNSLFYSEDFVYVSKYLQIFTYRNS